jgi:DNA-binding transcriptional LysR family regulator
MNIHHLELFYFVAKHGGIAAAVRNIPYGIQQPAVSGQIARLEESLGVKLFDRRPFALSPPGAELFAFIEPFFARLGEMENKLRAGTAPHLRIAAPALVLHEFLPDLLQRVRAKFSDFRLNLHETAQPDAEKLLLAQEIDLAVTPIEKRMRAGLRCRPLIELPLVLLVGKKHRLKDAGELWRRDRIEETLITFPRVDPVCAHFYDGLKKLRVEWDIGIEVTSTTLIERFVANGYGIGLSVAVHGIPPPAGVRRVPLPGFSPVLIGALWTGSLSDIAGQFLAELEAGAQALRRSSDL